MLDQIEELWQKFDTENKGFIKREEARKIVEILLGEEWTWPENFNKGFLIVDKESRGVVTKEQMPKLIQTITEIRFQNRQGI